MRTLLRTNDLVEVSFAEVILKDAGIAWIVRDRSMTVAGVAVGPMEQELLVDDQDYEQASLILRKALKDAEQKKG